MTGGPAVCRAVCPWRRQARALAFPFGGLVDIFERRAGAGEHEVFRLGQFRAADAALDNGDKDLMISVIGRLIGPHAKVMLANT